MKKIGKYNIIRKISDSGMSTVYQAYDPFMDRFVALKVPRSKFFEETQDTSANERLFYNETSAASRLHHPNIIEIYDAGADEDVHYIAMEYISGSATLEKFCRPDNLLPLELAGEVLFKCAEALDYAHRQGVIHQDIKPSNILLREERDVKISDFGLALLSDPDLVNTQPMISLGSPKYLAPERLNDEGITPRTDIFSFGVVMYEVLTGHHPFPADNLGDLARQIIHGEPVDITKYRGNLPKGLSAIVQRAMAKRPEDRYETVLDLAADLSVCFHELDSPIHDEAVESRAELLKKISLFKAFGDAEIWELLRWSQWQEYDDGECIIRDGDVDDAVYLIVKGEVVVSKNEIEVATLPAGDLFGEIAYLTKRRRTATINSKGKTQLLRLNVEQIERTSSSCQIKFQRILITTLIERLVNTTERLAQKTS